MYEPGASTGRDIYSVTRLNREARMLLESGLGMVWVQAEVSNFSRPGSGHWYFSLKDRDAQLRCAMFRQRNVLCALHAARRPTGAGPRAREPVRAARRLPIAG